MRDLGTGHSRGQGERGRIRTKGRGEGIPNTGEESRRGSAMPTPGSDLQAGEAMHPAERSKERGPERGL